MNKQQLITEIQGLLEDAKTLQEPGDAGALAARAEVLARGLRRHPPTDFGSGLLENLRQSYQLLGIAVREAVLRRFDAVDPARACLGQFGSIEEALDDFFARAVLPKGNGVKHEIEGAMARFNFLPHAKQVYVLEQLGWHVTPQNTTAITAALKQYPQARLRFKNLVSHFDGVKSADPA